MKVATGKVLESGLVKVEGEPLEAEAEVLVFVRERGVTVDAETEAALVVALAEADAGDFISREEFWASVPPYKKS